MIGYNNPYRSSPARLRMEAAGHAAQRELAEKAERIAKEERERAEARRKEARERLAADIEAAHKQRCIVKALTAPPRPTWRTITADVLAKHGFSQEQYEAMRASRVYSIVACRQELFYRLSTETKLSLTDIGQRTGGFDHTTVLHGVRRHAGRIAPAEREIGEPPPISD